MSICNMCGGNTGSAALCERCGRPEPKRVIVPPVETQPEPAPPASPQLGLFD